MPPRKLTPRRKKFVELYTDENNKETYLNATQSTVKTHNVNNLKTAASVGSEILTIPEVKRAIERRILKKEDIQSNLAEVSTLLRDSIGSKITEDNIPMVREFREYNLAHAKINGDLQERINNNFTQIVINGAVQNPYTVATEVKSDGNDSDEEK